MEPPLPPVPPVLLLLPPAPPLLVPPVLLLLVFVDPPASVDVPAVAPPLPVEVVPMLFEADVALLVTLDEVPVVTDPLLVAVVLLAEVLAFPDELSLPADVLVTVPVFDEGPDGSLAGSPLSEQAIRQVAHIPPKRRL